jgi:hypothetical protein
VIRPLLSILIVALTACQHARYPRARFDFGAASASRASAAEACAREFAAKIGEGLPQSVGVSDIVADPARFSRRQMAVRGRDTVDPYHGSVLFDPAIAGAALPMFGGCDDIVGGQFDWTTDQVCGTFLATVEIDTDQNPLKQLCPHLCIVIDGTLSSEIVRCR